MRVENLRSEHQSGRSRVVATVTWEDCDRPTDEIYFDTAEAFGDGLVCNPNAFLLACSIPALHYGEKRILLDSEICPELRNGLITAMCWLRHWYYGDERELIKIEAKVQTKPSMPRTPDRAGFFFSGGVDSLATLRNNRQYYPQEHPGSIKDGLLVFGLESDSLEAFQHVVNQLADVAKDVDVTFIPVYTNLYLVHREEDAKRHYHFWEHRFQGAAFAAIAHAFARRLTTINIASTYDIANLHPHGSHPLLDPNYGSSDLKVLHDGLALSRLDKVRLIKDWEIGLHRLRVCNQYKRYTADQLNCGQCEKCIRTMLELMVLGVLDRTQVFPAHDVSSDLVRRRVSIPTVYVESCYKEMIDPLKALGRHDLSQVVEQKIAIFRDDLPGWKAKIGRFDRKYLQGSLKKIKNAMAF